jgi:hypothetical protein
VRISPVESAGREIIGLVDLANLEGGAGLERRALHPLRPSEPHASGCHRASCECSSQAMQSDTFYYGTGMHSVARTQPS